MSENTSFSVFHLTEDQAIDLLETNPEQLESPSDRYIAATQLAKYPSQRTIQALIRAIQQETPTLDTRIVRRKSIETLGYLKAVEALPIIRPCLQDEDCYTAENAAWAIGEIGTQCPDTLDEITQLLSKPNQSYRLIIHTLAKLKYSQALDAIHPFLNADDLCIRSAAISTTCQLTHDNSAMTDVIELLQHSDINARRGCIQDLIDAHYYPAIPFIAKSPISITFRLRGLRLLATAGLPTQAIAFQDLQPSLEQVIRDHPSTIDMVHEYDQLPTLDFAIQELYQTDFGRCYLASQTLLESYAAEAPTALLDSYHQKGKGDYGAHYLIIKLLGWLKYEPAYDIFVEALHNPLPQFRKSRTAAAIALGELGKETAIPELRQALKSLILWVLQYASLSIARTL